MLEQKGELQIKDLLLKLQVLTYGIIEERKKSQSYLQRIKEFEATLQKKDSEIVELTKAKFDLQSKLTLELSKKSLTKKNDGYISSLINKFTEKPADQGYVTELEEKINQLKFEVKDLTQRLMEEKETFDQQKIKFQTMITLQNNNILKLQKDLEKEKKYQRELIEQKSTPVVDTESKEKLRRLSIKFSQQKDEYDDKISKIKRELDLEKKKEEEREILKKEIEKYKEELYLKIAENDAMKNQVSILNKQITQAKNDVRDSKLQDRFFQVERIKDGLVKNKKPMALLFRWIRGTNNEKGRCEVVFRSTQLGGSMKELAVNLLDFKTFKYHDRKKDYFDVCFMVSLILL
jgi:hypothetical protein